ncbi:MAG: hypothetical protein JOZ29_14010, partial [Deltaproteobacteria bacterium]|nr:hypothetical protein [Deltaproteobacteria bacterium]
MECFPRRVFFIALCLSLAATRLQAGDKPAADPGRRIAASGAAPADIGTPAAPAIHGGSLRTANNDRMADADTDSADAGDASAGSDAAADGSDGSAPGGTVSPAVAANGSSSNAVVNGSRAAGDQDLITMNFQNVDLPVLAKFISEITGKNFVLDENVRGRVSIISPTRVTPEQAYSIFQSVLQVKGFTTVQAGTIIKIIPSRDVRESAELTQSQQPGITQGDQYVTRMIKLRNTDATSVMSVIQPMISHDGLVAAFPQDNTLI